MLSHKVTTYLILLRITRLPPGGCPGLHLHHQYMATAVLPDSHAYLQPLLHSLERLIHSTNFCQSRENK